VSEIRPDTGRVPEREPFVGNASSSITASACPPGLNSWSQVKADIDAMLEIAAARHIYILFTLFSHDACSPHWNSGCTDDCVWSSAGGPPLSATTVANGTGKPVVMEQFGSASYTSPPYAGESYNAGNLESVGDAGELLWGYKNNGESTHRVQGDDGRPDILEVDKDRIVDIRRCRASR
jgi:hypothetical protein